ncbi:MAG: short-chain dehydrogenase/reductase [Betaproteobacteria bacterium]|nr:short-chain dehydrogenase/reductase [Betaproteobacteria bacterium]
MNAKPLAGKTALITGAGRNIGRAIALMLADAGAAVAVHVRGSVDDGRAVVEEITAAGGRSLLVQADITDRPAVDAMVAQVAAQFGGLEILVNNAATRLEAPFPELTYADWRGAFEASVDGAFHCTQAAWPWLAKAGGSVINLGGLTAHIGAAERAHVTAAKAALVGFTRGLAHEGAPVGVTINCVVPGMIATVRGGGSSKPQARHQGTPHNLLARRGAPDDIASAVLWLVGPGGQYTTGQTIHVNGGAYLGS